MAEVTKKRGGHVVRGIFSILIDYPDCLQAKEVLSKLETIVPPTEFEASTFPNNPSKSVSKPDVSNISLPIYLNI